MAKYDLGKAKGRVIIEPDVLPEIKEWADWHRLASESFVTATISKSRSTAHEAAAHAHTYAGKALAAATTNRQRIATQAFQRALAAIVTATHIEKDMTI